MTATPAPALSAEEQQTVEAFDAAPAAPESFDPIAALRRVEALADDYEEFVADRGRPTPGTYDHGLNMAQAAAALDIRAALATQDGDER